MADPNLTKTDPIASLGSILDLFHGKTTTTTDSGTSTSTKSNLTQDQLNTIIGGAMAPVNAAQKTAGMYGSTPLAVARGQIAADTAAKYAGTTTTTSGGTRSTNTPGPLDPSNLGSTASSLLLTQLGAPLLKKLGSGLSLDTLLGGTTMGGAPSLLDAAGSMGGGADAVGSLFGDAGYGATAGASDLMGLGDAVTPFLGDIGDAADSAGDFFSSLFVKDGGRITKGTRGYASGGYVDKNPAPITRVADVNPTISASGAVDPNPTNPAATGSVVVSTVGSSVNKQLGNILSEGSAAVGGMGGGPANGTLGGFGLGIASSVLGHSPLGVVSGIIGKGITSMMNSTPTSPEGSEGGATGEGGSAVGGGVGDASGGAIGGIGDGGAGAAVGGVGDGLRTGGAVSGPGTGTSDSIKANLSDGETVITAQTTKAMRDMFGSDVFHTFESIFNPSAAASQLKSGRA